MAKQLLILFAAFVGATLIALALGAKNLGNALTFGQMAFAAALLTIMLTAPRPGGRERE